MKVVGGFVVIVVVAIVDDEVATDSGGGDTCDGRRAGSNVSTPAPGNSLPAGLFGRTCHGPSPLVSALHIPNTHR